MSRDTNTVVTTEMNVDEFRKVVKAFVQANNTHRTDLARAFEVAPSTVDRWWLGTANPHPRMQAQIVKWIREFKRG